MEKYIKYSDTTGRTYNIFGCVHILNIAQAIYYMQHHVKLLDLQISEDRKTGNPILVFVFNKDDTKEAYDLWCLNKENES
jgi:hypothetical protein